MRALDVGIQGRMFPWLRKGEVLGDGGWEASFNGGWLRRMVGGEGRILITEYIGGE